METAFNALFGIIVRILSLGLFLFALAAPGAAWGRVLHFVGKAFDLSGDPEYVERHEITYEGPNVARSRTTYYDLEDRILGTLNSEYEALPQFGDYTFRDLRKGYEDGAWMSGDRLCLFRRQGDDEMERHCIPKDESQIVGQGFHHFIVHHLDAIAEGAVYHVKLVLPSKLDQFRFRIRKRKTDGPNLLIRLEADNWFLRLLAPHVDVVYERESGRLLRYEGVSNVADADGKHKHVRIDYFYGPAPEPPG